VYSIKTEVRHQQSDVRDQKFLFSLTSDVCHLTSALSHHFAQHEQNQKQDEESKRNENEAQAWIVRSFFNHMRGGVANSLDALDRFFDYAACRSGRDG